MCQTFEKKRDFFYCFIVFEPVVSLIQKEISALFSLMCV